MAIAISKEMVFSALPPRAPDSHKGTYGSVLAVCGCEAYRGAAALCCMGALRVGAGLVTLAAPEVVISSVASRILEAVFLPDPTSAALGEAARRATACVLGCGRTPDAATAAQMQVLLAQAKGTVVLDAGGLCSLAGQTDTLCRFGASHGLIVTPHPGEMARMTGLSVEQVLQMPAEVALHAAAHWNAVVVLKGHHTLVATPRGTLYENHTGNAGLARGGSGDVLAGIIGGLCAQGLASEQAAVCGVWLHGAAADHCARTYSMQAMLPEQVPLALQAIFLENGR